MDRLAQQFIKKQSFGISLSLLSSSLLIIIKPFNIQSLAIKKKKKNKTTTDLMQTKKNKKKKAHLISLSVQKMQEQQQLQIATLKKYKSID